MTRFDVISSLSRASLYRGQWDLDDDAYEPMSVAFVLGAWRAWVASLPNELQQTVEIGGGATRAIPRWVAEVFDCDNIARDFAVFLDRCMAVDAVKVSKPRGNSGAGKFNFLRNADPNTAHARQWFIDYDGVTHTFDAGDGSMDPTTQPEKETTFAGESV